MSLETISRSRPKARKSHHCSMCAKVVPQGQKYERQSNVFDGKVYTYKICWRCQLHIRVFLDFVDVHDEGATREDVHETAHYYGWKAYLSMIRKRKTQEETK